MTRHKSYQESKTSNVLQPISHRYVMITLMNKSLPEVACEKLILKTIPKLYALLSTLLRMESTVELYQGIHDTEGAFYKIFNIHSSHR